MWSDVVVVHIVAAGLVWVLGITQPYTNATQISFTSGQGL